VSVYLQCPVGPGFGQGVDQGFILDD
jgi:hypothetical protein